MLESTCCRRVCPTAPAEGSRLTSRLSTGRSLVSDATWFTNFAGRFVCVPNKVELPSRDSLIADSFRHTGVLQNPDPLDLDLDLVARLEEHRRRLAGNTDTGRCAR